LISQKPKKRDSDLGEDGLQDVLVHVVAEFVRENGLDLVLAVVLQQGVGEDDAPRSDPMPVSAAFALFDFSDSFHS
jgi:hypothetical protein